MQGEFGGSSHSKICLDLLAILVRKDFSSKSNFNDAHPASKLTICLMKTINTHLGLRKTKNKFASIVTSPLVVPEDKLEALFLQLMMVTNKLIPHCSYIAKISEDNLSHDSLGNYISLTS
ncbi:hypothetical protein Plhal304r1_c040g0118901 [Plasmopara halstedii]